MIFKNNFILLFFLLTLVVGCDSKHQPFQEKSDAIPFLGKIVLLSDEDYLNGNAIDSFSKVFESPFIISPQPETEYEVKYADAIRSSDIFYDHDKIIITGIADEGEVLNRYVKEKVSTTGLVYDKNGWMTGLVADCWSKNQSVYVAIAKNRTVFNKEANEIYSKIKKDIEKDDLRCLDYENTKLNDKAIVDFSNKFKGRNILIPHDYVESYNSPSTIWYRKDVYEKIYGLLIHESDGLVPLDEASLKSLRNEVFKNAVKSKYSSTMLVDDSVLPMFIYSSKNGRKYKGVWKRDDTFMGGSFVSRIVHDSTAQKSYLIDGFYFAPGHPKRDGIKRLEYLVESFSF